MFPPYTTFSGYENLSSHNLFGDIVGGFSNTRSYAALRAADLDWIVGPGYSLRQVHSGEKPWKTNLEPWQTNHGNQPKTLKNHETTLKNKQTMKIPWQNMETNQKPWKNMKLRWKTMETNQKP